MVIIEVHHSRSGYTLVIDGWIAAFQTSFRGIVDGLRAAYEMDMLPTQSEITWSEGDVPQAETFSLRTFLRTSTPDLIALVHERFRRHR